MKKLYGWKFFLGRDMFRFKSLLRSLAVWLGVIAILSISSAPVFASEKLAPAGSKQGPEIFVQMAKESIIYFGGLKFTQEVQT